MRAPPNVHHAVWHLVCCAALEAMEYARKLLWVKWPASNWPSAEAPTPHQLHSVLTFVANHASLRFWRHLSDFADSRVKVPSVFEQVPSVHPFLCVEAGKLRVCLPPTLQFD